MGHKYTLLPPSISLLFLIIRSFLTVSHFYENTSQNLSFPELFCTIPHPHPFSMFRLKRLLVFLLIFCLFMQTAFGDPPSPTSTDIGHLDSTPAGGVVGGEGVTTDLANSTDVKTPTEDVNDDDLDSFEDNGMEKPDTQADDIDALDPELDEDLNEDEIGDHNDKSNKGKDIIDKPMGGDPHHHWPRPKPRHCTGICDSSLTCHCRKYGVGRCRCVHPGLKCRCINHRKARNEGTDFDNSNSTDASRFVDELSTPVDLSAADDLKADDLHADDSNTAEDLNSTAVRKTTTNLITAEDVSDTEENQESSSPSKKIAYKCSSICNKRKRCPCPYRGQNMSCHCDSPGDKCRCKNLYPTHPDRLVDGEDLNTIDDATTTADLGSANTANTPKRRSTEEILVAPEEPVNTPEESADANEDTGKSKTILPIPPPIHCRGICNMHRKCNCMDKEEPSHCRCRLPGFPCSCTTYITDRAVETVGPSSDTDKNLDSTEEPEANEKSENIARNPFALAPRQPCSGRCTGHGKCMCGGLLNCRCRRPGKYCSCVN
ncbi:uncharacterized protein BO97DRAFT_439139 [Aspergillus homomorphus CBS 101889]|uniref:Uncharacterized protein n=1 Tax=Aspergillus homomorphus (strain CBS 101889) TaxID=1450537 RepID=A0A395IAC0_ASPHC|nr:hypothetical protein BO97DRAFT_439139 [Aspergillus homomorphus CBS 101889]RAL17162.1 hypothetical protein BO97DRAFT_439139 [Aspergillus homomorphus CBS 101889]